MVTYECLILTIYVCDPCPKYKINVQPARVLYTKQVPRHKR